MAVKLVGRLEVIVEGEIENNDVPASVMLKRLPVVSPWAPILMRTRSPEAVAGVPGSQERSKRRPDVSPVEVEPMYMPVPVVRELTLRAMEEPVVTPV